MHRRGFHVLAVLVLALSLAVAGCSMLARKTSTGGQVQGARCPATHSKCRPA